MPAALITGASSGIGETFARALAARRFDLILVARRLERLKALAREFSGIRAEALAADLGTDDGLARVEQRIAVAPNLELLVNNAGFGTRGRFWESPIETQDAMHRVHILATMRLTHAALHGMVPRGRGAVINVSSVAAFAHAAGGSTYGASKAWINAFTEGLYLELKAANSPVRLQALCPGFTLSEFHDTLGMDRNLVPKSLWMTSDFVVRESLRGLDRGRLFVIPGWRYRWLVRFLRLTPSALLHPAFLFYSRKTKRI